VSECDREDSIMRRSLATVGCSAMGWGGGNALFKVSSSPIGRRNSGIFSCSAMAGKTRTFETQNCKILCICYRRSDGRPKVWVCCRSLSQIVGSSLAGGMNVCCECCMLSEVSASG